MQKEVQKYKEMANNLNSQKSPGSTNNDSNKLNDIYVGTIEQLTRENNRLKDELLKMSMSAGQHSDTGSSECLRQCMSSEFGSLNQLSSKKMKKSQLLNRS